MRGIKVEVDKGRYTVAYECYKARILYGFYACGDSLPTILMIAKLFRVAPSTAHAALALLEDEGYIKIEGKKSARIIYQATPDQYRENAARYFIPREAGIRDLIEAGRLIFEPFWDWRLQSLTNDEWAEFLEELKNPRPGAGSAQAQLYLYAMNTLDNSLILNLYWEMIRYLRFPYLIWEEANIESREALLHEPQREAIKRLKQKYEAAEPLQQVYGFIQKARLDYCLDYAEPAFFQWRLDRPHPQRRYTLVAQLIQAIVRGQYPAGSYLPSNPTLAREYHMGLNTVRRAIYILNGLGITSSFQGKGTLINTVANPVDLSMPDVRAGIRYFLEGLQLMTLMIRQVLLCTLETLSPDRLNALAQSFEELREQGRSYVAFGAVLVFIERSCPLLTVRECFRILHELLAWGQPLALQHTDAYGQHLKYVPLVQKGEQLLKDGDIAGFAKYWEEIFYQAEEVARRMIETEKEKLKLTQKKQ